MTRINLKDMAVLIEKSPRTEAFFIVADAIKDGLIRPAEVMDYVRKFFPKGEDGTFHKGMFFCGLYLGYLPKGLREKNSDGERFIGAALQGEVQPCGRVFEIRPQKH